MQFIEVQFPAFATEFIIHHRFRHQKRSISVAVSPRHFEEGLDETQTLFRASFLPYEC